MKMHRFERCQSPEMRSRGLWEAPPAGIVLGTNETDFMGSFTMSSKYSILFEAFIFRQISIREKIGYPAETLTCCFMLVARLYAHVIVDIDTVTSVVY